MRRFVLALALLMAVLLQAGGASGRTRYSEWLTFNEVTLDGKRRVLSRHSIFPYRSSLSPDQRQLAYVPSVFDIGPSDKLWVAEVRSNSERLLFDAPDVIGDVAWAPSGRVIAITFADGIWLINFDGTGLRRIADSGYMLAWSPDSKSLAFSRLDDGFRWHVTILSLETGKERVVSGGFDPRWSPDARFLLFEQATGRNEPPKIRMVRATGGAPRTVARGSSSSWSPDGRRIAFLRADQTGPAVSLWVIDRNGSHRRRIASRVSASNWSPAWAPNARQIAFVRAGAGGCRSSAYVVPVTGGRPKRLARETREISPLGWFSRRRVLYQARRCQS